MEVGRAGEMEGPRTPCFALLAMRDALCAHLYAVHLLDGTVPLPWVCKTHKCVALRALGDRVGQHLQANVGHECGADPQQWVCWCGVVMAVLSKLRVLDERAIDYANVTP
eukprot:366091-Chlamydomonas_euryale.AAC.2